MRVNLKERVLSASAYVFGIPALYIVLNDNKKKSYVGSHGARAFTLWISFLVIFFIIRFSVNLIWRVSYLPQLEMFEIFSVTAMGCCALYFGFRSLFGKWL
jgi:hypothetical protein